MSQARIDGWADTDQNLLVTGDKLTAGQTGTNPLHPVEHYLVVFMNLKTRFKVYKVSISYLIQIIFFFFPDENSQIIFFYFFRLGSPIFLPVDTEHNIRELVYSAEQSYNLTA